MNRALQNHCSPTILAVVWGAGGKAVWNRKVEKGSELDPARQTSNQSIRTVVPVSDVVVLEDK